MADISIDFGPIIRAINSVNSNIGAVDNHVNRVDKNLGVVNQNLEHVRQQTMREIAGIKSDLKRMENQQIFLAALQRAMTEIIRIRQELESKFGTHKLVRDNMLGILQATDLGLITESTISRCTEELMLSAPKYWLAPALIALAAWISNNESLAKRALAESIRRDREKTCLLFALITRRVNAGRLKAGKPATNTTFEWLSEYFKLQNPMRMKKSVIAYIDAYSNGVFGEDKYNICNEQIIHWMDMLKEHNPDFAEEQYNWWLNKFNNFNKALNGYPQLASLSPQFPAMHAYLQNIDAIVRDTGIRKFINDIVDTPVDYDKLINAIDVQLTNLISNYEDEESELREREEYLQQVERFKGNEARAENYMKAIKAKRVDLPLDFAKHLSNSIFNEQTTLSEKKTAFVLLRPYIKEAFHKFITSNKNEYPQDITLQIKEEGRVLYGEKFTWQGNTQNAENRDALIKDLSQKYEEAKKHSVEKISDEKAKKKVLFGKILTCSVVFLVIPVGPLLWRKGNQMLKENEKNRADIRKYYDNAKQIGCDALNKALDQRIAATNIVNEFVSDEKNEAIDF